MNKFFWLISLLWFVTTSWALTVDGHAFLENQSDHSGITVSFLRLNPYTFFSTTTDQSGYYSISLTGAFYNVSYYKIGYYQQSPFSNIQFIVDTTLPDITLLERQTTLHVPDMYATIQEALNIAIDGDTILVAPGIYPENLNIFASNIILASHYFSTGDRNYIDQTVIDGNFSGRVINYGGWGTRITGFTLRNGIVSVRDRNPGCGAAILVGGEAAVTIDHCVFTDNYAEDDGIVYIGMFSNVDIIHCTFSENNQYNNSVIACDEWSWVFIKNSIIWGDQGIPLTIIDYADVYVEYCIIWGGYPGVGIINEDPLFADPTAGNFHLTWENFPVDDETRSPGIDSGDYLLPVDPDGTVPDIGAFYFDQAGSGQNFYIAQLLNNAASPDDEQLLVTCILGSEVAVTSSIGLDSWIEGGFTTTWTVSSTAVTVTSDHTFDSSFDLANDPEAPLPHGDWSFHVTYNDGSSIHEDNDPLRIEATTTLPTINSLTPTGMVTGTLVLESFLNNALPPGFNGVGLINEGDAYTATFVTSTPWGDDGTAITSTYTFASRPRDLSSWLFYLIFDKNEFEYALAEEIPFPEILLPGKPENVRISISGDQVSLTWDEVPGCIYRIYSTTNLDTPYPVWDLEATVITQTLWTGPVTSEKRFYIVRALNQ